MDTHKPEVPAHSGKAVAAASIGNALEWYDFSVFAFFATYVSRNFFIEGDDTSALIKTFLVFAAGFIARPLGAVLLGLYGDRVGRKAALTLTIALMAVGTLIIAVSPTAASFGNGAAVLLLLGRLFQGFSAGGEIGGATAFLVESAPEHKRGLYASCLQASMGFSNILAAVVGVGLTTLLSDEQLQSWGWRIPFIIGLLIVPVGFYIRRNLDETPAFAAQQHQYKEKTSLASIVRHYPQHLLTAFLLSVLWTVCIYTLIIYMPTYYVSEHVGLGFNRNQAFVAALAGNVLLVAGSLASGFIADRIGVRNMMLVGAFLLLAGVYPLLAWLHASPTLTTLIMVQASFCAIAAVFSGVAPVALSLIFPVSVRSTGMALSYNVAAIFFAGFTPALMTWATAHTTFAPAWWITLAATAAVFALTRFKHLLHKGNQNVA